MQTLRGKGAIVVGTKRVGGQIALRLAAEGINLAIAYRSSRTEAEALRQAASSKTKRACLVQCDLSVEEDVRRMVSEAAEQLGGLHFAVNLASGFVRTPLETLDSQAWDQALADAKGSYLLTLHAARRMMDNSGPTRGHIILFSDSSAMETPYLDYLPYLTAKSAIDFMSRAFAVELAPHGILVNAIAPGPTIRPPGIREQTWRTHVVGRTPLKRESSPDEMAEIIVTLLKSETITGETVRVDAGVHLSGPEPANV
ncbi:MAG: SDR family oxidoreductase [SAR202 cluster bacterium]|nr:SDR family oxidoreductase [SAR202 cluster bacterium]